VDDREGAVREPSGTHIDWTRRVALRHLERYATSEAHLVRLLKRRIQRRRSTDPDRWNLDETGIDRVVAEAVASCRALGLIDDRSYAETRTASGRRRGHSGRRLLATLTSRGVDREVAEAAVGTDPDDDLRAALMFARRRRLGPFSGGPAADDDRRRAIASLCRQGFGYGVARTVVDMDREDAEARLGGNP
jgi:regulatory protein